MMRADGGHATGIAATPPAPGMAERNHSAMPI